MDIILKMESQSLDIYDLPLLIITFFFQNDIFLFLPSYSWTLADLKFLCARICSI